MASFNPKVFVRPDGLKRIANIHLIALLEPWREYFAERNFEFPTHPDQDFPHDDLAKILLTYDPDMPHELMNGLYYIDEAASDETLEDLLERAAEEGIEIAPNAKSTSADIAVQIYLADRTILEDRAVKAIAFDKTAFRYYPGREDNGRDLPTMTDDHLARIAAILDPWFESKHRGRGTRVFLFHRDAKFWLVIRHGKPAVREGKHEENGEAGVAFYQPQKHDVVIYDASLDLLGINAESKGEKDLYRQTLGDVVFGDVRYFGDGDVFTLAPIRSVGPEILNCEDIEGVTRVRLLEVVRIIPGEASRIDIQKSSDLFRSLGARWEEALQRGRITSAKFGFLFEDSSRERSVHIRLDSARYDRDSDSERVESWLRERGFFDIEREMDVIDENEPAVAGA
jgi:hypothetical protein